MKTKLHRFGNNPASIVKPKEMKYFSILLFIFLFSYNLKSQVSNITDFTNYRPNNYIFAKNILTTTADTKDYTETFMYYDGLGLPLQKLDFMSSPKQKDIIQPFEYDSYGREVCKYLPYSDTINQSSQAGKFRSDWKTAQSAFYTFRFGTTDGSKAFAQTLLENSPINRVIKQGAPGNDWQPVMTSNNRGDYEHVIYSQYSVNSDADNVYYWTISGTYPNVTFTRSLDPYSSGALYKTTATDENGNHSTEYKDKQGKVVLKVDAKEGKTYYIYDDYELLRCVIPPLSALSTVATFNTNTSPDFKELCYYYDYDNHNNMVRKKLPGTVGIYEMVYDNQDRLIKTKDPNFKTVSMKYDVFSRPIETDTGYQTTALWQVKTFYDSYTKNGISYDQLSTPVDLRFNTSVYSENVKETLVKGKVTVSVTRVLNKIGTKDSLRSVSYYDKYGRVIQTISENSKGGMDRISIKYKYKNSDIVAEKTHQHGISNSTITQTIIETYTYDHAGRLLTTQHKVNSQSAVTLSSLNYDETGQMTVKKQGGISGTNNFLQVNSYIYNIRGWLTYINNPLTKNSGKLFNLRLDYVKPSNKNSNNISESWWSNGNDTLKKYVFDYDELNRLKTSSYHHFIGTVNGWTENSTTSGRYDESYTYDANGNFLNVTRYGYISDNADHKGLIDDLTYKYFNDRSNRLKAVGDLAADVSGRGDFTEPGSNGYANQEYFYDKNGNMIQDNNKGSYPLYISYNYLNLPQTVSLYSDYTNYSYTATGEKLGFNRPSTSTKMEYIGPFVYKNNVLEYIITSEGRGIYSGSDIYYYEYHIKDHLGNVRVAYKSYNITGTEILQKDNYYPFGMLMADKVQNTSYTSKNKLLYNGKEMQTDASGNPGYYDYGARMYDPQLGRFHTIDAFAEKYIDFTPYQYGANNPVMYIDVNGDSLWIKYRGENILYENGNIYNKDGTAYSGKGLRDDGSYKGFLGKAVDALNTIGSETEGQKMLSEIEADPKNVTIVKNSGNDFTADSWRDATNGTGSGGTVNWNTLNKDAAGNARPGYIGLSHELGHGLDATRGTISGGKWFDFPLADGTVKPILNAEKFSTHMENMIRAEHGLPLRTDYSDIVKGRVLIPGTSTSLFYGTDYSKHATYNANLPWWTARTKKL